MEVDVNSEHETSSFNYESTTVDDSDVEDDTTSSTQTINPFRPASVDSSQPSASQSIGHEPIYAAFIKQFQVRLKRIVSQEDLFNFLDHFWEKLKLERHVCLGVRPARFLARRIRYILLAVKDINRQKFLFNSIYFSKVSRVLGFYVDLELRASSRGRESGGLVIDRITIALQNFLTSSLESSLECDNEHILEAFIHMDKLNKSHKELIEILMNRFLKPRNPIFEPKMFSDRMYITYLVLYKKWIEIEPSAEYKKKLIAMCKNHIKPAPSIRRNPKYAPYLPKWDAENQNPTEFLLNMKIKLASLIEQLKIPDIEDNSDVQIVDVNNLTSIIQIQDDLTTDHTSSIEKSLSSTSISSPATVSQAPTETTNEQETSEKHVELNRSPSLSLDASIVRPKEEMDESVVIDLTEDEIEINIDEPSLSWMKIAEQRAIKALMLPPPPQIYPPPDKFTEPVVLATIEIDDDDDDDKFGEQQTVDKIELSTKEKPHVEVENTTNSNSCKSLFATQSTEISTNCNNSTAVTSANPAYSITSPTDSGIIVNNSGRNTVCSMYDDELTDAGSAISSDESDLKSNTVTNEIISVQNTDTEMELENDSEIENISSYKNNQSENKDVTASAEISDSHNNSTKNNLNSLDKKNDNCDDVVINDKNTKNSEILKTSENVISENIDRNLVKESDTSLNEIKFRCGPVTKTYQSKKSNRPRILTPTLDVVNSSSIASSSLSLLANALTSTSLLPTRAESAIHEEDPFILKTNKVQINKEAQSNATSNSNTGAVVFSMLPRHKPNVSLNLPSTSSHASQTIKSSSNVVFSTVIPITESKSVSSSIIKDWTKTHDDVVESETDEIESEDLIPSNILIRCDYFKSDRKSSPVPFTPTRPSSPYCITSSSSVEKTVVPQVVLDAPVKTSNKLCITLHNTKPITAGPTYFQFMDYVPAKVEKEIKHRPPRTKRVAFASDVEYSSETVKDEEGDGSRNIKIKIRKTSVVNKSVLSKRKSRVINCLPKAVPCSVVIKKLPPSNPYVRDYINLLSKQMAKQQRSKEIAKKEPRVKPIRRNSSYFSDIPFYMNATDNDSMTYSKIQDYGTDYDDVRQIEDYSCHTTKKLKRRRRSSTGRSKNKRAKENDIVKLPLIKEFKIVIKPLNLSELIVDPNVNIHFENEIENNDEIFQSFNTRGNIIISTPKSHVESPVAFHEPDNEMDDALETVDGHINEQETIVAPDSLTETHVNEEKNINEFNDSDESDLEEESSVALHEPDNEMDDALETVDGHINEQETIVAPDSLTETETHVNEEKDIDEFNDSDETDLEEESLVDFHEPDNAIDDALETVDGHINEQETIVAPDSLTETYMNVEKDIDEFNDSDECDLEEESPLAFHEPDNEMDDALETVNGHINEQETIVAPDSLTETHINVEKDIDEFNDSDECDLEEESLIVNEPDSMNDDYPTEELDQLMDESCNIHAVEKPVAMIEDNLSEEELVSNEQVVAINEEHDVINEEDRSSITDENAVLNEEPADLNDQESHINNVDVVINRENTFLNKEDNVVNGEDTVVNEEDTVNNVISNVNDEDINEGNEENAVLNKDAIINEEYTDLNDEDTVINEEDSIIEEDVTNTEEDVIVHEQDPLSEADLIDEPEVLQSAPSPNESQICEESISVSTLRFSSESDPNDDAVVTTTNEIENEVSGSMIDNDDVSSPRDELLTPEHDTNLNMDEINSICGEEMSIAETSENDEVQDRLNTSGIAEEIVNTNKTVTIPRISVLSLDQLKRNAIDEMLTPKPSTVLKANLCLGQINNSATRSESVSPKSVEETLEKVGQMSNEHKLSPTPGEDQFLIEEYIDQDIITNVVELHNHRSEGEQSCASEEIPSPPFETVIPKLTVSKLNDARKNKEHEAPIESTPFDEVLDLKSFRTLENDSSISEMENVGKRLNDNFNEIDEEETIPLSDNDIDEINLNIDSISPSLPETPLITSNQNDVTTTTLSAVQKKKNLAHRPFNRHIKVNNLKRKGSSNSQGTDIPETIVSSTTITSNNHLIGIPNLNVFNGTNNSSMTYLNVRHQVDNDFGLKKRRGRPKGSKNKRKEISQMPPIFIPENPYPYVPPPLPPLPHLKPTLPHLKPPLPHLKPPPQRRQSLYYPLPEIPSSSVNRNNMPFNNNPPYRSPFNTCEESLNQINRHRSLPVPPPLNKQQHRIDYRPPSCESDDQPLIHFKHSTPNHEFIKKYKKMKRNDSESPPFSLEKQFGTAKDLMDKTKTYMKPLDRPVFVPPDMETLIQNQTTNDIRASPITTTYRYDPCGIGGSSIGNCGNLIRNSSNNSSSSSDPITQSHQFVNYETSSSPERILTQHEHNYSNDSSMVSGIDCFPPHLPSPHLGASNMDYLALPYLFTQQQFQTPRRYFHRQ